MGEPGERRLFLAVLVVATLLAVPMKGANVNRTFDLVHSLERGKLELDPLEAWNTSDRAVMREPLRAAHVATGEAGPAAAVLRRHYFAGGAPGLAFFLAPFHGATLWLPDLLRELFLVVVGAGVPLALGTLGVRRAVSAATKCPASDATNAALVHAFGTLALPYGTRLYAHSLAVACLAWSLALVLEGDARRKALAGFLASAAIACDYLAGVPALALLGLAFAQGRVRGGAFFLAGGALPALLLALYHQACFGTPWATAYGHHDNRDIVTLPGSALGFGIPHPLILLELLAGTRRGMLETEPAALLGIVGLALAPRSPARTAALSVVGALLLLNASRADDWNAGYAWGPRYTINALPFLALGYPRAARLLGRAALPAFAASVAAAFIGSTCPWGFDVRETLDSLFIAGPRADGAAALLLSVHSGFADVSPHSMLLVSAGVAAALVLVSRPKDTAARGALVLAPWFFWAPARIHRFVAGPSGVDAAHRDASRRAVLRQLATVHDAYSAHEAELAAAEGGFPDLALEARARREAYGH
jgi:hypothetical protein